VYFRRYGICSSNQLFPTCESEAEAKCKGNDHDAYDTGIVFAGQHKRPLKLTHKRKMKILSTNRSEPNPLRFQSRYRPDPKPIWRTIYFSLLNRRAILLT